LPLTQILIHSSFISFYLFFLSLLLFFSIINFSLNKIIIIIKIGQKLGYDTYQEAFEKLSRKVDDLLENFLVGCFIAGLKDKIRLDVRVKQPKTLSESICVAHLIEERNQFQKKTSNQFRLAAPPFHPRQQQNSTMGIHGSSYSQRTSQTTGTFSGPVR